MEQQHLHIKNMVCGRCLKAVDNLLKEQNIKAEDISLGEIVLLEKIDDEQKLKLSKALEKEGFQLIDDKKSRIISHIKSLLIHLIHYEDLTELQVNLSTYLAEKLQKDYNYLSNLFSETENTTIEQFVIYQKIEKVKELLVYDEMNLSEISYKMGYSSLAHLSAQFKKITGFTPSQFKKLKDHKRRSLDEI